MEPTPGRNNLETIDVTSLSGFSSENYPSGSSLPGGIPCPLQHPQPGMMDSHYSCCRFDCPCGEPGCQLASHPDHLLETQPSQYHVLTSSMPGWPDTGHHSSVAAPWITNRPCDMMPGEFRNHAAFDCAPESMDNQRCQEGPSQVVTYNVTQPYHQASCPLRYGSRDQTAVRPTEAPAARADGTVCDSKSRKHCNCTKTKCLKLYCDCFAAGEMCSNCNCSNCCNTAEHNIERYNAIKACMHRNPTAFNPMIIGGKLKIKSRHNKGCNCKRSGCLKNYCECYEENIMCSSSCKCVGCKNYDEDLERKTEVWDGAKSCLYEMPQSHKDKNLSVITPTGVEDACRRLLFQAEEAEQQTRSPIQAERMVLEEFGHCLTQIVETISKSVTDQHC